MKQMCKRVLLFILVLPLTVFAQRKADRKLEAALQQRVQYLSDPALKNRPPGSPAEMEAAQYIKNCFAGAGLAPAGDKGDYVQSFIFDEGKAVEKNTQLSLNDTLLDEGKDYFPLPFSAGGAVNGNPLISVQEPGNVWIINIKEAEDNSAGPAGSLPAFLHRRAELAAHNGATGVIFYAPDSSGAVLEFNPRDTLPLLKIPAAYVKPCAASRFLKDETASVAVNLTVSIGRKIITGHNVVGYMSNDAPHTVVISTHYDQSAPDDNSVATAALIELAAMIRDSRKLRDNNYLFVDFSGHETGRLGMEYFLQHYSVDPSTVNCWINISLSGPEEGDGALVAEGEQTSPDWAALLRKAGDEGLTVSGGMKGQQTHSGNILYSQKVPVLLLSGSGQNAGSGLSVLKLVYNLVREVNDKGKLVYAGK